VNFIINKKKYLDCSRNLYNKKKEEESDSEKFVINIYRIDKKIVQKKKYSGFRFRDL